GSPAAVARDRADGPSTAPHRWAAASERDCGFWTLDFGLPARAARTRVERFAGNLALATRQAEPENASQPSRLLRLVCRASAPRGVRRATGLPVRRLPAGARSQAATSALRTDQDQSRERRLQIANCKLQIANCYRAVGQWMEDFPETSLPDVSPSNLQFAIYNWRSAFTLGSWLPSCVPRRWPRECERTARRDRA